MINTWFLLKRGLDSTYFSASVRNKKSTQHISNRTCLICPLTCLQRQPDSVWHVQIEPSLPIDAVVSLKLSRHKHIIGGDGETKRRGKNKKRKLVWIQHGLLSERLHFLLTYEQTSRIHEDDLGVWFDSFFLLSCPSTTGVVHLDIWKGFNVPGWRCS